MFTKLKTFWTEARKTVAAVVTGNIGWAAMVVASKPSGVTAAEWIAFATVNATALGVYAVRNSNT